MVALLFQQGIGRPERPQHAFEQRRGRIRQLFPSIARCACSQESLAAERIMTRWNS